MIANEFDKGKPKNVVQWVSSAKLHKTEGVHYHCAIKLTKPRRWKQVKLNIEREHGIVIDFVGFHDTYYDAFTYVTKQDSQYVTSPGHVDLDNNRPAKARVAIHAKRVAELASGTTPSTKKYKSKHPNNYEVMQIIIKNQLRTDKELSAFATRQACQGKDDLQMWIANHPNRRARLDVISTAWTMLEAESKVERSQMTRIELLQKALSEEHRYDIDEDIKCSGEWLSGTTDVLRKNNIDKNYFTSLIRKVLEQGRSKKNNIIIIGGTNQAKSFMFMPVLYICDCFTCPSNSQFNWVGAREKEVIFLKDFRCNDGTMKWNLLLNFLEGAPTSVTMPKNHFASDVNWTQHQPIFATAEKKIVRVVNNNIDEGETSQMDERWTYIQFHHRFTYGEVDYDLVPCPRCFAEFLLKN